MTCGSWHLQSEKSKREKKREQKESHANSYDLDSGAILSCDLAYLILFSVSKSASLAHTQGQEGKIKIQL